MRKNLIGLKFTIFVIFSIGLKFCQVSFIVVVVVVRFWQGLSLEFT